MSRKQRQHKIFLCQGYKLHTYQNRSNNFLSFVPWINYQGFRIYAKTVKYKNIIALNILFNRNFRLKIVYSMF